MAPHLVVHIVLVRAEKRKVQKLTLLLDGKGEGVCGLLKNWLLSGNGV